MNNDFTIVKAAIACLLILSVNGCDTDITGNRFENQAPNTELSVRDTSLVDNLSDDARLSSTVFASWSGDDRDGFIASFDVRFYQSDESRSPEEGWTNTVRNDSLILLPIPRGERTANVVLEVRAIDNDGLKDPTPARTIFPIQNSPPEIRFDNFELPPDTTFGYVSFAWVATDPEGESNLDRIEISLNDSLNFVSIPADNDFITLVGNVDREDPLQSETDARIFLGRGYQTSTLTVPGLKLDSDNTVYIRAVDQTDTTSVRQEYTWYVKKTNSDILFVNDFRKANSPIQVDFHLSILEEYLPPGKSVDVWTVTTPFVSGSAGNVPRSDLLPPSAEPALRQFLGSYSNIYWISTNTINSVTANNLPFVAAGLDIFFDNGGSMMVHSPVTLPPDPEDNLGNPALLLLPITDLVAFPDSLRPTLRIQNGTLTAAPFEVPGTGQSLPVLRSNSLVFTTLPYSAAGANSIPLMTTSYTYVTQSGTQGPWTGVNTVASISADRRIALFSLPLINESSGAIQFSDESGDTEAAKDAIKLILESLNFPQ